MKFKCQEIAILKRLIVALLEVAGGDPFAAFILLLEQLFENSIATDSFEEQMRYLFGTSAYTMFTIDKLMLQLVKTVTTLQIAPNCA